MLEEIKKQIEKEFIFQPNKNQWRDVERLIFEILRREGIDAAQIIKYLQKEGALQNYGGRNKFFAIKNTLIKRRFPLTSAQQNIDTKKIFLNQVKPPLQNNWQVQREFRPLEIYVEKGVRNSDLAKKFTVRFSEVKIKEITSCSDYLKKNKFEIPQLKKPIVFIVKEKCDFLKPCPCTKEHLSCGYWILNLGFGCPLDCSYCFLQGYANFPGIILPANLDDFFKDFDAFYRKLKRPIRIGTGEFCDSLALDEITEYSKKLIPYFKNKNVFFELKTKSNKIKNLLEIDGSANIVISWSLNPMQLIENEEVATAALGERLLAAKSIKEKGYSLGFHFDPIIYCANWQNLYKELINKLYDTVNPPFSWISLGTLRSHRNLKTVVEQRFSSSNIFYGELFLSEDKKLRYPKFLRNEIYKNMLQWIRSRDKDTPVYLCMESVDMWQILGANSSEEVERKLLAI